MNLKVILFALLCLMTGFSACNDDETDKSADSIPLIKTIVTKGNRTDSVYYEYDATGRVMKISHSPETYTQYTYSSNKININSYYFDPAYNRSTSVRINDKGLATSQQYGDVIYTFKYDSIGYHVVTNYNYDTVFYANIVDGNVILKKQFQPHNISITSEYEFLPNKNTIGDQNMGITWTGKQNANLPSKEIYIVNYGNIIQEKITEYTYEYDNQNRVSKRTTIKYGGFYESDSYTYY